MCGKDKKKKINPNVISMLTVAYNIRLFCYSGRIVCVLYVFQNEFRMNKQKQKTITSQK